MGHSPIRPRVRNPREGKGGGVFPLPRGTRMLPNLGALARGDAAATGGPASQGSQSAKGPRPSDDGGQPHGPSPTKVLPDDLLKKILLAIDTDDVEAACRAAAGWCGADTTLKTVCTDRKMWRTLTERVFKSTDVDRALFAHDELLETDPKRAFRRACFDRAAARVVGLKFLIFAPKEVKEELYENWINEDIDDEDGEHQDEEESAINVVNEFYNHYLITVKFFEWTAGAQQKYDQSKDEFKIFDDWSLRRSKKVRGPHDVGGRRGVRAAERAARAVLHEFVKNSPNLWEQKEPWKEFWGRADEAVHALAERVGRATVWVWRKTDDGRIEITDEQRDIAEQCILMFPAMEFSDK